MTEPDFSEMTGEEKESDESDSGGRSRTEFKQLHIKGRFGTKTVKNTEGCQVCGRNGNAVLMTNVVEGEVQPDYDRVIVICDHHEGDVRGDLEYEPELVQRREF